MGADAVRAVEGPATRDLGNVMMFTSGSNRQAQGGICLARPSLHPQDAGSARLNRILLLTAASGGEPSDSSGSNPPAPIPLQAQQVQQVQHAP